MLIFPLIYISSFLISVKDLICRNKQGIVVFLIFGLPIYTTSLSVTFQAGFPGLIPIMQVFKELIILATLGISIWELKRKIKLRFIDYIMLAYFCYNLLYVLLPVGEYSFADKLVAFKSSAFFALIYFTGRLFNPKKIYISKYFHYILLVIIAATAVLFFEIIKNQHLQTLTGYSEFNYRYFNQEVSGNYGLTWTFETSTGLKRFASFFANPLEFAAATLIALATLAGLYTNNHNKFKTDTFGIVAIAATQICIIFALSRASLASYFLMVYVYAMITKRKMLLNIIHVSIIAALAYFIFFLFFINRDLYEFIYETLTFTNPSSLGHILAWLDGIEAMIKSPLGLGLGESGRVGISAGDSVGGESQLIITGVQTGIIGLFLYLSMYIYFIRTCWKKYPHLRGKERKVCLTVLLMKIGFIIPMLTSEFESYIYISYISWFLCGLFVNMISGHKFVQERTQSLVPVNT